MLGFKLIHVRKRVPGRNIILTHTSCRGNVFDMFNFINKLQIVQIVYVWNPLDLVY